jgi:orotate phosphoribosyltransferase-like protein
MHDDKTVQRFIDLRVQGWSFARLAAELNVSKPTLIDWSRKHQHLVTNLVARARPYRAVSDPLRVDSWQNLTPGKNGSKR